MNATVHVVGFAGSLRRGSYIKAGLRAAAELLPVGMSLEIVDLAPIPLYNADLEAAGLPRPVTDFKARLAAADAAAHRHARIQLLRARCPEERHRLGIADAGELPPEPQAGGDHGGVIVR